MQRLAVNRRDVAWYIWIEYSHGDRSSTVLRLKYNKNNQTKKVHRNDFGCTRGHIIIMTTARVRVYI